MAVYLLHSTVPLVRSSGTLVRHYMGYAPDGGVHRRLEAHYANRSSAAIVQEFLARGARLQIGMIWPGETAADEQRRKKAGHLGGQCYLCRIEQLQREWAELLERDRQP